MLVNDFVRQTFLSFFDENTIDSYRPKYSNAHTILLELLLVSNECVSGNVQNMEHIKALISEAVDKINDDVVFSFDKVRRNYILKFLNTFHQENQSNVKLLVSFLQRERAFWSQKYRHLLEKRILSFLDARRAFNLNFDKKNEIRKLLMSLVSEWLYMGVSFKSIKETLSQLTPTSDRSKYRKVFAAMSSLKKYNVHLRLIHLKKDLTDFISEIFSGLPVKTPLSCSAKTPVKFVVLKRHLSVNELKKIDYIGADTVILSYKSLQSRDKYSAALNFQTSAEKITNFVQVWHPDKAIAFRPQALVYDWASKSYCVVNYKNLVRYQNPISKDRLTKLFSEFINLTTDGSFTGFVDKLQGSISHLSSSVSQRTIVNAYLNSWTSIEVLFNSIKGSSTIESIVKYGSEVFGLFYIQKLTSDFVKALERLHKKGTLILPTSLFDALKSNDGFIFSYDNFLKIILNPNLCAELLLALEIDPTLQFRIEHFSKAISSKKQMAQFIGKHKQNIEQHLRRLYRIRNEIIHGAKYLNENNLLNLSLLSLLTLNLQEYSASFLEKILDYSLKNKPRDLEEVFMGCNLSYRRIVSMLQDEGSACDVHLLCHPTSF